jgi:hypothetical protein
VREREREKEIDVNTKSTSRLEDCGPGNDEFSNVIVPLSSST